MPDPAPTVMVTPTVTVPAKPEKSIRWTVWVIILTGPVLIAMLWWIIARLTAKQWCAVQVNAAKLTGAPPSSTAPDCTTIILALLDIHRVAVIGLLIAIVIGYLVMVAMVLGAGVRVGGPGSINLDIGADRPGDPQ